MNPPRRKNVENELRKVECMRFNLPIMITWLMNAIFPDAPERLVIELTPEDSPAVCDALARLTQIESVTSHPAIKHALQQVLCRVIPQVRSKACDPRMVEDLLTQELEKLDSIDPVDEDFRKARKMFVAFCVFVDQEIQPKVKKSRKRSSMNMRDDTPIKAYLPKSSAKRRRRVVGNKSKEQIMLDAVVAKLQDMVDYDEETSNIHLDSDPVEASYVVRQLYKCIHVLKFSEK